MEDVLAVLGEGEPEEGVGGVGDAEGDVLPVANVSTEGRKVDCACVLLLLC